MEETVKKVKKLFETSLAASALLLTFSSVVDAEAHEDRKKEIYSSADKLNNYLSQLVVNNDGESNINNSDEYHVVLPFLSSLVKQGKINLMVDDFDILNNSVSLKITVLEGPKSGLVISKEMQIKERYNNVTYRDTYFIEDISLLMQAVKNGEMAIINTQNSIIKNNSTQQVIKMFFLNISGEHVGEIEEYHIIRNI